MKIAFIGGGAMGEAMLASLLEKGVGSAAETSVCDIVQERCDYLKQKYSVSTTPEAKESASTADVLVLAVKPQYLQPVLDDLKGELKPEQLVLSIIAGVTISTLSSGLEHRNIVRTMPNTPAQIGWGMSVWTATPEVSDQQKKWAAAILGAIGKEIHVDDENLLDAVTAVSGSGPAYFFLFVEALTDAAVKVGLSRETAETLVLQTLLGSGHLIEASDRTPEELRVMVTSPGGTTAEALKVFDEGGLRDLVERAVRAAYDKSRSLGGR